MASRKITGVHWHICRMCGVTYMDACREHGRNTECYECRTGRPGWKDLIEGRAPKDCCFRFSRPVTHSEELVTYKLAGDSAWVRCKVCARSHSAELIGRANG
jgi:hypothetical protein